MRVQIRYLECVRLGMPTITLGLVATGPGASKLIGIFLAGREIPLEKTPWANEVREATDKIVQQIARGTHLRRLTLPQKQRQQGFVLQPAISVDSSHHLRDLRGALEDYFQRMVVQDPAAKKTGFETHLVVTRDFLPHK